MAHPGQELDKVFPETFFPELIESLAAEGEDLIGAVIVQ